MSKKGIIIFIILMAVAFISISSINSHNKKELEIIQNHYFAAIRDIYFETYQNSLIEFTNILELYTEIDDDQDVSYINGLVDSYLLESNIIYIKTKQYNDNNENKLIEKEIEEQINLNINEMKMFLENCVNENKLNEEEKVAYEKIIEITKKILVNDSNLSQCLKSDEYLNSLKEQYNEIDSIVNKNNK